MWGDEEEDGGKVKGCGVDVGVGLGKGGEEEGREEWCQRYYQ